MVINFQRRKEAFDEATRALHQALLDHRRLQPNRPVDHAFPAINAALNEVQDYLLNYGSFETTKPAKGTSIVKKEFFSVEVQTENIPDEPAPIQKLILDLGTQTDLDSQPAEIIKQYSDWHCQMELIKLRTEAEVQTDNNFDDLIAEERSFLSHSPVFEAKWKPEASSTPLGKKPQSFSRVTVLTQKQPDAILGGSERGEALIAETDALTGNVEILATTYEKLVQVQIDTSVNNKLNRSVTCPEALADLELEVPERPSSVSTNCLSMISTCSTTSTFGLYQRSLSGQMSLAPNFLPNVDRLTMKMRLKLNNPLISVPRALPETVNGSLEKSKSFNRSHNDSID
ncbi:hypothetical protein RvY_11737-1 [Ramazzottius varieornatus]|uniref:Uncharacterized protein n=1 Tax=Ramazzottius varieornatus TaxID=947166 RepID=A0A1D1VMH8_RAMVA|nr:hypothetical protein RvY_11737-1 [Ramazzottius varieornatus]